MIQVGCTRAHAPPADDLVGVVHAHVHPLDEDDDGDEDGAHRVDEPGLWGVGALVYMWMLGEVWLCESEWADEEASMLGDQCFTRLGDVVRDDGRGQRPAIRHDVVRVVLCVRT